MAAIATGGVAERGLSAQEAQQSLGDLGVRVVMVTGDSAATALAFFVRIWKRVRRRKGRMAFCNVSDHEPGTGRSGAAFRGC
jgi:hypothetical protein